MTVECLNGKELRLKLKISTTRFYKLKSEGMPYHQFDHSRAYYLYDEVEKWLGKAGYHQDKTWVK